jgi:2,4-dienoyl-CoA reductase-like NADH-dependent reductase (Old Yellow Enzyme family)/thioredoxin reductase
MQTSRYKFDRLFSEFRIRDLELRNRIVFLPHYTAFAEVTSLPSETETYYYTERAKGGVGLIVTGNYAVSPLGQMHRTFINASDKRCIPEFTRTTQNCHTYGAKIIGQLSHAGATKTEQPRGNCLAPSQVVEKSTSTYTTTITKEEIGQAVHEFETASATLVESGFDGVEVKVAHDGLLRIFVSPYYNHRTDEYGGSFENKMRIIHEVFSAIRRTIPPEKVLGVRLSLDEFEDDGFTLETGVQIGAYMAKHKLVDYISCDAGTWNTFIMQIPPMTIPLGFAEYMAAAVKKHVDIPVIAFGRINDPVQAEQILENGSADLVGMARQLLCDPETANKSKAGAIDDIRKCIGCEEGCIGQVFIFQPIKCIQNPAAGREKDLGLGTLVPAQKRKKLVIVGGGVAGLKCAEIAARRGHSVVLYEKAEKLGGQVNILKNIPFRNEFTEVTRYLEYQVRHLPGVEVKLSREADEAAVRAEKPDALVVATGAVSFLPPHVKSRKAVTPWQILDGSVEPGKRVVVYDPLSFNEGVGIVEYLFDTFEGVRVHYITPQYDIAMNCKNENKDIMLRKLLRRNLKITPHTALVSAEKEKLTLVTVFTEKKSSIPDSAFDTLVWAGSMKSVDELYWRFQQERSFEVHRLGDAKAPSCVEIAIRDAELLARSL